MTSNRALAILYRLAGLLDDLIQADDPADVEATTDRARRGLRDLDAASPGWRDRTPRGADAARGRGAGSGELGSPWAVVDTATGRIVGRWRTRELAEGRLRPGQAIVDPETP